MRIILAILCLAGSLCSGATLDFSGFSTGDTGSSTLVVGPATFSVPGGTVYVYAPGAFGYFPASGGLCALNGPCQTDFTLTFASAVSNLKFYSEGADPGDNVTISYFNGLTLLGSTVVTTSRLIDLSASPSITRLVFDDQSIAAGIAFGDFSFNTAQSGVPEPGSWMLISAGIAGLAYRRSRKSA